jgi:4-amino-4-deoxy-L-arabinose transferase-like glycosyltransferase
MALFLAACAVRLWFVWPGTEVPLGSVDQSEYLALAQNIRLHGTFSYGVPYKWGDHGVLDAAGPFGPTAGRSPLYPMTIAALWWGDAPPVLAVRILQVILSSLIASLIYLIGGRVFDHRAGLLAGIGMAFAPLSAHMAATLHTHVLFTFLATLGLWLFGRNQSFLAGIALGAATLTRSVLLPVLVLAAVAALIFRFRRHAHLLMALGAILVISPWTVRNAITQHAFIPVASMGWGANIFLGTFDVPYGGGHVWMVAGPDANRILAQATSIEDAERRMLSDGLRRIAQDPVGWLQVRAKQYPRLFLASPYYLPDAGLPRILINVPYFAAGILFLVMALWGLFRARHKWRDAYYLAAIPLFLCVAQFPALTEERYSVDMIPMLMIFAGFGLSQLIAKVAPRKASR